MTDLALAPVAGYVGTKLMEPVGAKLYGLGPEQDRRREDEVRPDPPYAIAARKTADLLGVTLTDKQHERLTLAFHYGLAIQWAPLYPLLRRKTGLGPITAGLATAAAMSPVADEMMTPALGLSAPNRAYPLSTHLRGFVGHLVFGLGAAATTEAAWLLLRTARAPGKRDWALHGVCSPASATAPGTPADRALRRFVVVTPG